MRYDPFPDGQRREDALSSFAIPPAEAPLGTSPPASPISELPPQWRPSPMRWVVRAFGIVIGLMVLLVAWLAVTAPLSKSLEPPAPPSITLLAADGTPFARRGAIIGDPVDVTKLPDHVPQAFLAIEDRRFYGHWGIDPRGILRALVNNTFTSNSKQGGSTITQQLAKNAFLSSDRTIGRKLQEVMIAFWLEAWLSKDEILSRYLSNVYFGDNVYGLDAAARHYFSRDPDDLTTSQAAMLAGLVKAPSRLAPTSNLKGARERQEVVVKAMMDAGFLTEAEAKRVRPAKLRVARAKELPNGTYFADWVLPEARDRAGEISAEQTVQTTLDLRLQKAAERAVRAAGLRQAQAALVAMRPDGRVVAMVGGKSYADSPFNRATQARRQPGSTFKLFVYLAALRAGMTPDSVIEDRPVTIGDWSPENSDGRYRGPITLREAFARSSNVAAARLTREVGPRAVIRAARSLGITTPIPEEASIALGTATTSLLEMTAAYAAIASGEAPVRPRGLAEDEQPGWLERLRGQSSPLGRRELEGMRELLHASVQGGTGHGAALAVDAFGKTGTTQDNRDALFIGYAGDLVVGVWLGNDDNTPNPGLAGGGAPARIWRDFMARALGVQTAAQAQAAIEAAAVEEGALDNALDPVGDLIEGADPAMEIQGDIGGMGLNLRVGRDGSIEVLGPDAPRDAPPPPDRLPPRRELPPETEQEF